MNIVYGITDTGDQFSSGRKIKKSEILKIMHSWLGNLSKTF